MGLLEPHFLLTSGSFETNAGGVSRAIKGVRFKVVAGNIPRDWRVGIGQLLTSADSLAGRGERVADQCWLFGLTSRPISRIPQLSQPVRLHLRAETQT